MATIKELGLRAGDTFIHSEYRVFHNTGEFVFIEGEIVRRQEDDNYLANISRCSSNRPLKDVYPMLDVLTGIHQTVLDANDNHFARVPKSNYGKEVLGAA